MHLYSIMSIYGLFTYKTELLVCSRENTINRKRKLGWKEGLFENLHYTCFFLKTRECLP
jgi:hypothetical protein